MKRALHVYVDEATLVWLNALRDRLGKNNQGVTLDALAQLPLAKVAADIERRQLETSEQQPWSG